MTSHLHLEIDRETDREVLDDLCAALASVIDDVFAAVGDWTAMRAAVVGAADELRTRPPSWEDADDMSEAAVFLEWLADDHFTFVAAVRVDPEGAVVPGSELGVARRRALFEDGDMVEVDPTWTLAHTKVLVRSTVHRDVPLDCLRVRRFVPAGSAVDETRLLGLYTANVYSQSAEAVPLLRRKVAQVVARSTFAPTSHAGRTLAHVLETYHATSCSVWVSTSWPPWRSASCAWGCGGAFGCSKATTVRAASCRASCICRVSGTRHRFACRSWRRCGSAYGGRDVDFTVLVDDSVMARLHVVVSTPDGALVAEPLVVEAELAGVVRAWVDDLHDAFVEALGEEEGIHAYRTWRAAFPPAYQFDVDARDAVADVSVIDALDPAGDLAIRLEPPDGEQLTRSSSSEPVLHSCSPTSCRCSNTSG